MGYCIYVPLSSSTSRAVWMQFGAAITIHNDADDDDDDV